MKRLLQNFGYGLLDRRGSAAPQHVLHGLPRQIMLLLELNQGAVPFPERPLNVLFVDSFSNHVPRLTGESACRDNVSLKRVSQ